MMSSMLISASISSAADMDDLARPAAQPQHDLANMCESLLNELNKDSLITSKAAENNFNRCLLYYMVKFSTNNEVSSDSEEAADDEPLFKARETRRVKSIKNFWKRRAGSAKATKKFW
jgi:hypothetical protein